MDKTKVESEAAWPIPSSIKELRGFLRLSSYYRMFIRNYSVIARPLTNLLKKNAWGSSEQANAAFKQLKQALCLVLVLALPDFNMDFCVETNASGYRVRGVFQQQGKPMAYFNRGLVSQKKMEDYGGKCYRHQEGIISALP
ncbi:uncharacterized mitochondrial protein AtMg00860-like [Gossypium arboreum]|uniref:uncharacterized mitochondrial protein AtMg00860-like n=1 Tax=Gossypium arboreum TaxID=29729 RepID=UPI0008194832|nr:uncharacterized mitochondrial protein AtMg00860-like [Gossypium arboreum]